MEIFFQGGWDSWELGNNDSKYKEKDIEVLIGQLLSLPGIGQGDYTGVPYWIAEFSKQCLHGNERITVEKGIHQRWGKNPDPHIQISFRVPANGGFRDKQLHVCLSETPSKSGKAFRWKTVGITCKVAGNVVECWPAVFLQSVDNIQKVEGKKKKRMSIGTLQPLIEKV